MRIEYVLADPAKNNTVLVLTDVDRALYADTARKLLSIKSLDAEQVGFVKQPIMGGEARLEMMGGEFCGNAARSFGLFCAGDRTQIRIEITGCDRPLLVRTGEGSASAEMPLPTGLCTVEGYPTAVFDGIVHLLAENMPPDKAQFDRLLSLLKARFQPDAAGVLFLNDGVMVPVVYVEATDTAVWERSCGSGTFALACIEAVRKGSGTHRFEVVQPGGTITAEVTIKDGVPTAGNIGGAVFLTEKKTFILED